MTLEFDKFEKEMFDFIHITAKGRIRACTINSIKHLKRAWLIKEIDPEIAIFKAITAEEEAPTSILLSLKDRRYKNADKLKINNHNYKQAVYPFFRAISKFMADNHHLYKPIYGKQYYLKFVGEGEKNICSFYFLFIMAQYHQSLLLALA